MPIKCTRLKADGSPCLAPALKNSDVCFFHASNAEFIETVKKQDEAFDLATELKHELKRVQNAKGNQLEKTKLALEIMRMLSQLEQKSEPKPDEMTLKERIKSYRE
jgi:hypothetical protein